MKLLIVLLALIACTYCIQLPHIFKTCNRTQTNFNECVKEAAEFNIRHIVHPYKELRLPGLKPLLIPSMMIGAGKRAVAVEQYFTDCNIYGLDHISLDKFQFDFEKKILILEGHFVDFTKKCNYKLNGRVLLLPIHGQGESTISLKNMEINGYLNYEEVKRNGKTYLRFHNEKLSFEVGHAYFHFDNLFNGNKGLGDSLNKVLNDNWKEVFDDVKVNYSAVISEIIQSLLNKFWSRVSLEEAFNILDVVWKIIKVRT